MRIGIDARLYNESGIGRYIRNLIKNIQVLDAQNNYFIFLLQKEYDTLVFRSNFKKVLVDFKWYSATEQLRFPKILNGLNLDLVHFPHFNVPIFYQGKFIVTIHDLIHQHFNTRDSSTKNPFIFLIKKYGYEKVLLNAVNKSIKIITPSRFVKNQLIEELKVGEAKISVTPEGVDDFIVSLAKSYQSSDFVKIQKKFNINLPYIFYIGNAQPHKNLKFLIQAFFKIKSIHPKVSLILSGPDHIFWERLKNENESSEIIFTGFVSEQELVLFYKNAQLLVIPSLEEGFGIPVLEAQACGCPVVSSKAGSLPEVGGDAVIYFDPKNEDDLVRVITDILGNENKREELIEKGYKNYQKFSWLKMTQETLKLYRDV